MDYFDVNMRILVFDFIFSPMLFLVIIFDMTFKLHKGKKCIVGFMVGELVLTFTFFFLKMVAYVEDPEKKFFWVMAFRIPFIFVLITINYNKIKGVFVVSSCSKRKNAFLEERVEIK